MRAAFALLAAAAALGIWTTIDGRQDGRTVLALLLLAAGLLRYRRIYLREQ